MDADGSKPRREDGRDVTILSWNVAALKSLASTGGSGTTVHLHWLKQQLDDLHASIICFQETKISRDALSEDVAIVEGYYAFYAHCARHIQSGAYSGVATYIKKDIPCFAAVCGFTCCAYYPEAKKKLTGGMETLGPSTYEGNKCPFACRLFREKWEKVALVVESSISEQPCHDDRQLLLQQMDAEGRSIMTDHGGFVLINVYCPFATREDPARYSFKMNFQLAILLRCEALIESGREVVLVGDMNAVAEALDQPDVVVEDEFGARPTVQWMRRMLRGPSPMFLDTFRVIHPQRRDAFTCWNNQTSARKTNYGRRIDYILATPSLCRDCGLKAADVQPHIEGSDHCPCVATFHSHQLPFPATATADTTPQLLPPLCTSNFPEFRQRQADLRAFYTKTSVSTRTTAFLHSSSSSISKASARSSSQQKRKQSVREKNPKQLKLSSFLFCNKTSSTESTQMAETTVTLKESNPSNEEEKMRKKERFLAAFQAPPVPLCNAHRRPMVLRQVLKGDNRGRYFYCCDLPAGKEDDPNSRCKSFIWQDSIKDAPTKVKGFKTIKSSS